ncbi:MAG: phospholipase D family protein [Acidobacteria bacterium]|nr:phospholipase D family protein [Acidobacteriota bacterium]
MDTITVLYTSAEIHKAIKKLYGTPSASDRRIAIVAYVGTGVESYLPHPQGMRIICSPSPGGTDPDALRRLIKRGARVEFSDALHMKVYWSKNRGCIIASANASTNALGVGRLKEAGILLSPGIVDIQRLVRYSQPRPVTRRELQGLDRKAREYEKKVRSPRQARQPVQHFLDWYHSHDRTQWKLAWIDHETIGTARAAKEKAHSMFGEARPNTWVSTGKGRVRNNDWLLCFVFTENGVKSIEWKYVDFIVKASASEKRVYSRKWPYHAVQVRPSSQYPAPPFRISRDFHGALSRAIKRYGRDRIEKAKTDNPPVMLLKYISEEIANQALSRRSSLSRSVRGTARDIPSRG